MATSSRQNLLNMFKRRANRPLMLPRTLKAPAELADKPLTIDALNKFIKKHEEEWLRYDYLEKLYQGYHDIFSAPEKEFWKPDNRLAVNFPRYITETFCGYGYGVPIKVTHPEDGINERLQDFQRMNEITDHDAEMVKKCCIYGHAFEYLYQDEKAKTKITACSPKDLFVVYSDDMKRRALFAVRYGYRGQDEFSEIDREGASLKPYGEILYRDRIVAFSAGKVVDERLNPYGYIPVVEWRLNDNRIGLYEQVAGLVESYNYTIAEKANDIDAFAEAYLEVLGTEIDEDDVAHIRDNRLINFFGTDNAKDIIVQFLQKPTADGTQENLLNRLENLIYQISMVANISDDTFGSTASGVSLAYKLQAMSNLAMTFDRKIEKSLRKRYKIFSSLSTNVPDTDAYVDIDIKFTRNIPRNLAEEANVAKTLEGITSHETQLSILSFVADAKAELQKIDEEGDGEREEFHFPTVAETLQARLNDGEV